MNNLNLEILHRIANGNTAAFKVDEDFERSYAMAKEEREIVYCSSCGFPVEMNYEKEIKLHIDCKGVENA